MLLTSYFITSWLLFALTTISAATIGPLKPIGVWIFVFSLFGVIYSIVYMAQ